MIGQSSGHDGLPRSLAGYSVRGLFGTALREKLSRHRDWSEETKNLSEWKLLIEREWTRSSELDCLEQPPLENRHLSSRRQEIIAALDIIADQSSTPLLHVTKARYSHQRGEKRSPF